MCSCLKCGTSLGDDLINYDTLALDYIKCPLCSNRMIVEFNDGWDEEANEENHCWWVTPFNLSLKERAKANEKNCKKGINYMLYDLAMHGALAEPYCRYAVGFPVDLEYAETWNKIINEISSTFLMCYDDITEDGKII